MRPIYSSHLLSLTSPIGLSTEEGYQEGDLPNLLADHGPAQRPPPPAPRNPLRVQQREHREDAVGHLRR